MGVNRSFNANFFYIVWCNEYKWPEMYGRYRRQLTRCCGCHRRKVDGCSAPI